MRTSPFYGSFLQEAFPLRSQVSTVKRKNVLLCCLLLTLFFFCLHCFVVQLFVSVLFESIGRTQGVVEVPKQSTYKHDCYELNA